MKRWQIVIIASLLMISGWTTLGTSRAERARPIRIGVLTESWGPTPWSVGLRDGLVELGYRENEDFVLGVRFTQGNLTALPAAARQLVQFGVDLIIVGNPAAAQAAQRATTQIPIVYAGGGDPVKAGLIQSFAHPGGNLTGITNLGPELSPKRLEIFRELIPGLKRVLYPYDAADAAAVSEVGVYREAARRVGIELVERPVRTEQEAQTILAQARKGEVDGVLKPSFSTALNIPGFALEVASQQGIPTMFDAAFWVERGALASYGPDFYASGRQAARLVDKIIKGVNPADIPVETNPKIEFAINLKTAKALGLSIPPVVLFQADKIIR